VRADQPAGGALGRDRVAGHRAAQRVQHVGGQHGHRGQFPSSAWAFANQGSNVDTTIALRWNGTAWTGRHDFPAWSDMNAAVVIGKADAWAFGQIISPFAPYVAHYNGTIGESLPHPNPSCTSQGVILKYGP